MSKFAVTEAETGLLRVMRRRRGLGSAIFGLTLGLVLGFFVLNYRIIASRTSSLRPMPSGEDDEDGPGAQREEMALNPEGSAEGKRDEDYEENLLFVGVMTANKYLGSRAKAVYETWGKSVPGKIAFFSSEFSSLPENCPELPLVTLSRVDDGYPPQKKSFLMLQYMWKNYGDRFEWFLRADDDVYVRTDKLEKLLRSVDSRKAMYIGQAGRGNNEEFGLLSLEYDENFCMGGPGVIMSRETLKRIVPHIKYCLKNLYTTHEDVELGRCVQKYAGIPCTWSYEMQSILYHNSSGNEAFTGNLKRKEVHRAITLHPVKSPPHMYRLHNYIRGLKIQDLQHERIRLHRDVSAMADELGMSLREFKKLPLANSLLPSDDMDFENEPGDTEILGVPAGLRSFKPKKREEVIPWDFYSRSEYSLADANPRRRIHSHVKEGIEDITREVMASINSCSRQRGRVVEERATLYGYRRVDAYGADTILDLLLIYRKYRGRKITLPVRRHVYLHQHFTGLEIREVVDGVEVDQESRRRKNSESSLRMFPSGFLGFGNEDANEWPLRKKIKFVLPLSGRYAIFERFLKNYEEICLLKKQWTELLVVLYHRDDESYNGTLNLVERVRYRHGYEAIRIIKAEGNFSRARALDLGVAASLPEDLLFFVDVDVVFTASALARIRLNTILNKRVYFPVVFSQFDPRIVHDGVRSDRSLVIDENSGYWRQFGFGIVSIYKADYLRIGGFDLSIKGWGKEDVGLYDKAVKSELQVFRSPDKNLIHVYHEVECDEKLNKSQLAMCLGSRADTYAATETLAHMIYENPEYLKFAKNRRLRLNTAG